MVAIFDLFSKRQKKLRGEFPDVYQYEDLPSTFRVQVVHIIESTFGRNVYGSTIVTDAFKHIHKALCQEYGVFTLKDSRNDYEAVYNYFLEAKDYERALDIIELSFRFINKIIRGNTDYRIGSDQREIEPEQAIRELNERFKEHGIGYQFESNELIRVDSQVLHAEVVKPVLILLGKDQRFIGVNEEYLSAHSHFRHGRYKECLVDTLKAFESVMKAISQEQGWSYNQNDTAKKLINVCFSNNLIPAYLQTQFSSLQSLLESGTPTIRNKLGGHGQGASTIIVTEAMASYALHLSATNIVFLVGMEKENFNT